VHEQFKFTWRMNLILAGAAVSICVFIWVHYQTSLTCPDCIGVEPVLCPGKHLHSYC
jgi:hypothetical protein